MPNHSERLRNHSASDSSFGENNNRRQVSWTRAEFRELDSQTWNRNIWRSLQFLGFLVERPPTHSLQFAEPLSTRTRRIPGSVRKLGTNTVPATHCKDSLSRPRRFANLGTPTADVGGRGFANWRKVSRDGSGIRELDSQIRNCNTRQRPIFTSFSVKRSPTHALQFSSPGSSRTRHIQTPVRKPRTHTPARTRCKDSDPHCGRFTKPRAPTAVVVPVPNFVDRCAMPWTRIQYRQPALQRRSRLKTPAMSIAGKIARGASDDPRSSIGTAEAARRRLRDTSLERGRGRSNAWTRQARCLPALRHRRQHAVRDAGGRRSRTQ